MHYYYQRYRKIWFQQDEETQKSQRKNQVFYYYELDYFAGVDFAVASCAVHEVVEDVTTQYQHKKGSRHSSHHRQDNQKKIGDETFNI